MCLFITHFKPKVAARNIKVYKAFMLTFPEELEDSKVLTGVIRNYYIPTNHLMDDTDNYASIKNVNFPFDANKTYWIAWFIEVDGTRQYAVSADYEYTNYNNVVSKDGLPYGIVVANDNGTFKYPKEKVSIFNTYKSFTNWVKGSSYDIGKPEKENVYKYCFDKSINGAHKIWDYQDLQ